MQENKTVLVGYSGHGKVVGEAAFLSGQNLRFYAEKIIFKDNPYKLEFLGDERLPDFKGFNKNYNFILGIGDNHARKLAASFLIEKNENISSVIHPESKLSTYIEIGEGVYVGKNVSINPFAKIGNYSIVNTSSIIEHECLIGSCCNIGPGVVISGNVTIGDNAYIGANTFIKQGIKIGDNVIIGGGSVIIRDIESNKKIVGNPGREI